MKVNSSRKKFVWALIFSGTLLSSGYIYATPYLSILGFKTALENKDSGRAEKFVNFDSVRQSLKVQLKKSVMDKTEKEIDKSPFGALSMMIVNPFITMIINTTVEATVTPSGLEMLLEKGELTKSNNPKQQSNINNQPSDLKTKEVSKDKTTQENKPEISLYYKTFNLFILSSKFKNSNEPLKASWRREGLTHWRLTTIDLPKEIMSNLK